MPWEWIFFFPAMQLAFFATLNFFYTCNTPEDAGFDFKIGIIIIFYFACINIIFCIGNNGDNYLEKLQPKELRNNPPTPSIMSLFRTVFVNPVFIFILIFFQE